MIQEGSKAVVTFTGKGRINHIGANSDRKAKYGKATRNKGYQPYTESIVQRRVNLEWYQLEYMINTPVNNIPEKVWKKQSTDYRILRHLERQLMPGETKVEFDIIG